MKLGITILILLSILEVKAQSRGFVANDDSCKSYQVQNMDTVLAIKESNYCERRFAIGQVTFDGIGYSRNGSYQEFFDSSFNQVKKTGYFFKGVETGFWREYYANGNVKYEGSCKVILVILPKTDVGLVKISNLKSETDTVTISYSNALDFLTNLELFNNNPPFKVNVNYFPSFYSVKDGNWVYYSEDGMLIKRVHYSGGKVLNN